MQIVRVEHQIDGKGIFRSVTEKGFIRANRIPKFNKLHERHRDYFPTPYKDRGIERAPYYYEYCAFKSIDELQKWVTKEELKNLIKKGFNVLIHEVSKCCVGEYQVLYDKEYIVTTLNVNQLFLK